MSTITVRRPGLLGHKAIDEVFNSFFNDNAVFDGALRQSTKGYPVADSCREDDGSTVMEFALAGFKKKDLTIDVRPDKRSITVVGNVETSNEKRKRIAQRNFTRTYVNYDSNLDLTKTKASFDNGLLTVRVPQRAELKPVSISID